jgi:HEAT repeat protein
MNIKAIILIILFSICFSSRVYSQAAQIKPDKIVSDLFSWDATKSEKAAELVKKNKPAEIVPMLTKIIIHDRNQEKKKKALEFLKVFDIKDYFQQWFEILQQSEEEQIKILIINHLSSTNDRRVILPIALELKSTYSSIRDASGKALESIRDDRIYPVILEMASSSNQIMRIYALEAMMHVYDTRLYQVLADLVKDPNKSIRIYAMKCMYKNQLMNTGINLIRNAASNDTNDDVKIAALEILGNFQDTSSLNILYKTVTDKNRDIRYISVKSIYKMPPVNSAYTAQILSTQLAIEKDPAIIDQILETMIKLRSAGDISSLKKVISGNLNEQFKRKAIYILGITGDERSVPVLIEFLSNENFRIRSEICNSLGSYINNKLVSGTMMEIIINDTSRYVKLSALYTIKKIYDKKIIINLLDIYHTESDNIFKYILYQTIREYIDKKY